MVCSVTHSLGPYINQSDASFLAAHRLRRAERKGLHHPGEPASRHWKPPCAGSSVGTRRSRLTRTRPIMCERVPARLARSIVSPQFRSAGNLAVREVAPGPPKVTITSTRARNNPGRSPASPRCPSTGTLVRCEPRSPFWRQGVGDALARGKWSRWSRTSLDPAQGCRPYWGA